LLWIWRNRQKISENIIIKLNHVNFFSAISRESDGAIWQAAEKELKKLIQENSDFQDFLLRKDDEENILEFLDRLNSTEAFTTTEKQSLIVKLSRKIPILKKLFESGKAKKITPAKSEDNNTRSKDEIFITSIKSFNEKIAELNDIINVQVPENTKAIAVARAHGDLRENAEYAAAKERQKYLNEHRAMLEMRIAITRPTDFSDIIVSDKIIVGSTVHLKHDNNKIEIYHILGAWDSVPEKKYISYETELGKILIGRKKGDTVNLPGGITCMIEKLSPLSDKIRNALI
jgi:transcription elongation GreA/GreB family factor